MLKKLFGKSEYFLEIDDKDGDRNGQAAPSQPAPSNGTAAPPQAKPDAKAPAQPQAKPESKPESKPQPEAKAPAQPQAKPEPKPEPKPQRPQQKEFATKYLVPKEQTPRRRPGANMKSFLDMAKDTNMR